MEKLVNVEEMKGIEAEANEKGLSYAAMMENAGKALAEAVKAAYGHLPRRTALGLVGSGNNGGDTLIALRELAKQGWKVWAYLVRPRPKNDELIQQISTEGGMVHFDSDEQILLEWISQADIVLDGVLGTGIKLPLKPDLARVLKLVKEKIEQIDPRPRVIAVDCPSGVDCDSGEAAEETLNAELTVCMAAVKTGLLSFPASDFVGSIQIVDIGFTDELDRWATVRNTIVEAEDVKEHLPPRRSNAHKGTFGTAIVAAGSVNFTGAALLSGKAAYRTGAGLVTMAIPSAIHTALAGQLPEATWLLLPNDMGVISENAVEVMKQNLGKATALLLGPGWGQEETTFNFLSRLLTAGDGHKRGGIGFMQREETPAAQQESRLPALVVDADGLKLLARIPDWPKKLPGTAILTPHPGEFSVLTGLSVSEIQKARIETAEKFAREWGHVVILKGACTVIAAPDGSVGIVPVATPALARAGTGDVLAGIVTGLRAQGVDPFPAAFCGVWIHAHCGLAAQRALGSSASVLAGDVLEAIPAVFQALGYR